MKNKNIFKIIITITLILLMSILSTILITMKILPIKYILLGMALLLMISIIILLILHKRESNIIKIISIIYILLQIIIVIFSMYIFTFTSKTVNKLTDSKYETISYSIVSLKDNSHDFLDYDYQELGILKNEEQIEKIKENIGELKNNLRLVDNLAELIDLLISREIDIVLLKTSVLEILDESDMLNIDEIKIVKSFDITFSKKDIKKEVNVSLEPFTVLISGIDTAGPIKTVSRSDVNILVTVNPKTYEILLVHIPRDYYVEFNGLGTKDKLTHSGIYGINMTIKTIEDFMGIDINYYVRINFSSFIKLIDIIGNVTVYNPVAFKNGGFNYQTGDITLNSRQALLFARARKMLAGGDLDRGKNQQRVIVGIIEKLSDPSLAKDAYKILDQMSNSFMTNMDNNEIKSLINFELNKLPKWKVESYNLTGDPLLTKGTPFYPNYELFVFVPHQETISTAKVKIQKILAK